MLKIINKKKIEIILEPHKVYTDLFKDYISYWIKLWRTDWNFFYKDIKIGTWCIKSTEFTSISMLEKYYPVHFTSKLD